VLTRKGFEMILKLHPEIGIKILKGIASLLVHQFA
jgi:CRP/FNR family cyclic AMP-dependent transcriptional regulator